MRGRFARVERAEADDFTAKSVITPLKDSIKTPVKRHTQAKIPLIPPDIDIILRCAQSLKTELILDGISSREGMCLLRQNDDALFFIVDVAFLR